MSPVVTLYGLSRSVYTRIARLALEEKAVPYRLEEVEIFGSSGVPAAHTNRHPFGRIPVLSHGDLSIYETAAICHRPMVWGVFVQRVRIPMTGGATDEALVATSLIQTRTALAALAAVAGDSPFFAGTTLSLADLHAYPMLRYLFLAPEGQAAIGEHRAVAEWLARLGTRASVQRTLTQYEQHAVGSGAP